MPAYNPEKTLEKYGWKRGDGIGLHGQGRVEPIEVVVKKDLLGCGSTSSCSSHSFDWWNQVYFSASKGISVEYSEDREQVQVRSCANTTNDKKTIYNGLFVRGGMLQEEKLSPVNPSEPLQEFEAYHLKDLRSNKQIGKKSRLAIHEASSKDHSHRKSSRRKHLCDKSLSTKKNKGCNS